MNSRHTVMQTLLALGLVCFGLGASAQTAVADLASATRMAASTCAACHGATGDSTPGLFPRLAGQQETYLVGQLQAFRAKERGSPEAHEFMWGVASRLDDATLLGLARYYAMQDKPAGLRGDVARIREGAQIYQMGDAQRQVMACSGCHGANAEGRGDVPRLAGQHAGYLLRQLELMQKNSRETTLMHGVVPQLTLQQSRAVAEYLQSR